MRGWSWIPALCGGLAVAACGPRLAPEPTADLRLVAAVPSAPAARTVLAVVAPYTRADIASLVVRLYDVVDATETEVAARTLAPAELDTWLTFGSLRRNRLYRARGTASATGGAVISDPAASVVDIPVGVDATVPAATLPIRLIDRTFDGRTTSAPMTVTDGVLIPAGIETMSQLGPWVPGPRE